jgi:hypothetical protein
MNGLTKLERARGFEPLTASLEGWNSTTELRPPIFSILSAEFSMLSQADAPAQSDSQDSGPLLSTVHGGQARIRTLEADGNRFTVCPLCPLGYLPEHRRKFLVSVLRAQKQTIPHTVLLLSISPTGDYCSGWTTAIPEAANFTSDIDICQVGWRNFLCIFADSRANSLVDPDSADYLPES